MHKSFYNWFLIVRYRQVRDETSFNQAVSCMTHTPCMCLIHTTTKKGKVDEHKTRINLREEW